MDTLTLLLLMGVIPTQNRCTSSDPKVLHLESELNRLDREVNSIKGDLKDIKSEMGKKFNEVITLLREPQKKNL